MTTALVGSNIQNKSTDMDSQHAEGTLEHAFDQHWSWVCHTLYRLVGDWDEAEDLALQVFIRLHQHPPRDESKVGSWLHRVATNAGLNALRSRLRRQRYEQTAGADRLQQALSQDPAIEVEQREMRRQVRVVLAEMKPRAAQLLIYRMMGLTYVQIASAINVAPGSVGTLLARAERVFERRYRALVKDV